MTDDSIVPEDAARPRDVAAPVDARARERVASDLASTLFVTAGAGSGKTTALVRRLVAILCDTGTETGLEAVAAITFTESAAAELSVRLRAALEAVERESAGTPRAAKARAALNDYANAAITTLHGFAHRLISEHLFEAGVPPRFAVRSDGESAVALDETVRGFLDAALDDPVLAAWFARGFDLGLRRDALAELARRLHEDLDRTLDAVAARGLVVDAEPGDDANEGGGHRTAASAVPGGSVPPPPDPADVLAAFDAFEACIAECTNPADKVLTEIVPRAARARGELGAAVLDGDEAVLVWAQQWAADRWVCGRMNLGAKANWPDVDAMRARRQALADAIVGVLAVQRHAVIGTLVDCLAVRTVRAAHDRWRRGELEFCDLLVLARNLVRDHPEVRAELHARYRYLFIDEFQDTDPLQAEIALALTSPPDDDLPAPGRLFVVGDAQQSIYRFRRADVDGFVAMRSRVGGAHVTLSTNFRSVPGICAWVNDTFDRLLDSAVFVPLRAGRAASGSVGSAGTVGAAGAAAAAAPPVWWFGREHAAGTGASEQARVADAADVTLLVRRLHDGPAVDAPAPAPPRAFAFGDIAVLVPDRNIVRYLEPALTAAGIPYRIESKTLMYATETVTEVWLLLRALVDGNDAAAVVATLRGPAFGCTDAELIAYAAAGGRWRTTARCPETLTEEHAVVRSLARLRALADDTAAFGVANAVQVVASELHLAETYAADARPRDAWRRLRFVIDQARAFEDDGGNSLERFVRWLERQRDAQVRIDETLVPETDDDAVRIQTVHGAKGLEYPAVVLCGLSTRVRSGPPPLLWDEAGGAQVKLGGGDASFATPGYAEAAAGEASAIAAERNRLLYVAATRARDVLAVSTHRVAPGRDSAATPPLAHTLADVLDVQDADLAARCDWLDDDALPARYTVPDPAGSAVPAPVPPPVGIEPTDLVLPRAVWQERRAEAIADLRAEPVVATTLLARSAEFLGLPVPPEDDGPDLEPWDDPGVVPGRRPGAKGTAVGRAVHRVLEAVDFAAGADEVAALAAFYAAEEDHPQVAATVAKLARQALASPVVAAARGARRMWRELYVAATIEGTLVEGYIDLAFENADGTLVVVDWKTDRINDTRREVQVRYRVQAAAYAAVLEAVTGATVAGCRLVFCSADPAVVVPLEGDLLRDSIALVHDAARRKAEFRPLD